jgi:large subunit ribosomal protein L21
MYAIVICGGRQHKAVPGTIIDVEKLSNEAGETVEPGQTLVLDQVLLAVPDEGTAHVGQPLLAGFTVQVTVLDTYRAKKIHGFKYKPKIHYRRQWGHRQSYTRLRIESITGL